MTEMGTQTEVRLVYPEEVRLSNRVQGLSTMNVSPFGCSSRVSRQHYVSE